MGIQHLTMSKATKRQLQTGNHGAQRRFVLGLSVPLFIALMYWPITISQAPTYNEGLRWLQNNPAVSVFQLIFLPTIAGTLLAGIAPAHLRSLLVKHRFISIPLLALLLLMGTVRVIQDS